MTSRQNVKRKRKVTRKKRKKKYKENTKKETYDKRYGRKEKIISHKPKTKAQGNQWSQNK